MAALTMRPFLMFEGQAADAIDFYLSIFPDAHVQDIERYGPGEAGAEGTVKKAAFRIGDQTVLCTDSFVKHDFSFTPAFSFFVECTSVEEIARLASALAEGGMELMPMGDYGFSRRFTWVSDRFGVSWQLNLA